MENAWYPQHPRTLAHVKAVPCRGYGLGCFPFLFTNLPCSWSTMRTGHTSRRVFQMWAKRVSYSLGMGLCPGHTSQPGSSSQAPAPAAASDGTGVAFSAARRILRLAMARCEVSRGTFPWHLPSPQRPRGFPPSQGRRRGCAWESPVPCEVSQGTSPSSSTTGAIYPGLPATEGFPLTR